MKRILLSLVAIATISLSSFGQAPEGFKYQAVVREAGNLILNNQAVGMRMTIQQGAIGGATIYQETFALNTNGYGLVNLEIGSGTVVSGTFATIDWSAGPFFIETAVDVTGGTSYVVMGTSQLMSVPYALHAKTAENVTNDAVDDADADPANEIQTISRTGTTVTLSNGGATYEDSVGVYTAGTGIDITGNVVSTVGCTYSLGDYVPALGGYIFYLDGSNCHGLVAQVVNIGGQTWDDGSFLNSNAFCDWIYGGGSNQGKIIGVYGAVSTAALTCENSTSSGFNDWYLPSLIELNMMRINLFMEGVGGFGNYFYWSSLEQDSNNAFGQNFTTGNVTPSSKTFSGYVRAIRKF